MLIRGGMVIDADGQRSADVRTSDDGRIGEVAPGLAALPGEPVHDATGKLVIPGGIDAHTHLHMPVGSIRVSDDFVSGTRAAAIGGTTTIIDYVTVARGEDPMATVATWRSWAEPSVIDWSLHLTFTEAVPSRWSRPESKRASHRSSSISPIPIASRSTTPGSFASCAPLAATGHL